MSRLSDMNPRTICARLVLSAVVLTLVTVGSSPTTSAAVGTISGTVIRGTGGPLVDAWVTATSLDGGVTAGATTNTSGSYTITVEPGTYCVSFGVDNNTPASTTYGGAPNCRAGATPVTVNSGIAVGTIDAVVRLGLIAGTLRDRAGAPVAGASISGDLVGADSFIRMTTSPAGEFAIKDLLPGTYCLAAFSSRELPTVSPGTPTCSSGEFAVQVLADVTPTPIDIRVDTAAAPDGRISGVVRYGGLPAAGRPVSATGIDVNGGNQAVTAADGSYTIAGLAPGSYCVTVGGLAGSIAAGEAYRNQESCATATPVVVGASPVTGIDVTLDPGGVITGIVTGPGNVPLEFVNVDVTPLDRSTRDTPRSVTTGANGQYITDGIPAGSYCVTFKPAFGGYAPETYRDAAGCQLGATPVVVVRERNSDVDARLSFGGSIVGRITAPAGIDPTRISVTAFGPNGSRTTAPVNAAGDFSVVNLTPGGYCLSVITARSSNLVSSTIGGTTRSCSAGGTIAVTDGSATTVNATPQQGGSVSGFAIGPTGRPIGAPELDVGTSDADRFEFAMDDNNTDGSYIITGIPPGRWCVKLAVDARGVGSVVHERAASCAAGTFVTVVANQNVGNIDLIPPAVGVVSGRLLVPAGTIHHTMTITLVPVGSAGTAAAVTDVYNPTFAGSGVEFRVTATPGTYCVIASLVTTTGALGARAADDVPACDRGPRVVTVRAFEETAAIDITLRPTTFVALDSPVRLMDTRAGEPTVDGLAAGLGAVVGGTVRELQVSGRGGIPGDATSAVLNVTAVNATGPGFVTVFPCGGTRPTASNLNVTAGRAVPNAVVTKLGTGGTICVFAQTTVDLVIDVSGHLPRAETFTALSQPARLTDSRSGEPTVDGAEAGTGAIAGGTVREVQVAGRGGLPVTTSGVVLNVTAIAGGGAGFLTLFPCGAPRPTASNLNYTAGQVTPNLVVTKLGVGGKVCVFAQTDVDVAIDVSGHVPSADTFAFLAAPARLMDTRDGEPTVDGQAAGGGPVIGGVVRELQVAGRGGIPANAAAAVLNVTAIGATGAGYLTVFPCGTSRPTASNLNYTAGQVTPNAVFTRVGTDGRVCVFAQSTVDIAVDIAGSFLA